MAAPARGGGVFSVQHIPGFRVIKSLWRGIPMEHVEVLAIVIGVALNASRSGRSRQGIGGMQAMMSVDFGRYLAMTLAAPKRGRPGRYHVALSAIGGAVEALMGPGQGAGRYLAVCGGRKEKDRDSAQKESEKPVQHASVSICSSVHPLPCVPGWLRFQLR